MLTLETPPIRIDGLVTAMAGPSARVTMDWSGVDWVTAFKSEVVDADSGDTLGGEYFCHSQIQLPSSKRLMVTATGTDEIRFPEGFGMPVGQIISELPPEQQGLSLLGMVLNNHDATIDRNAKVRGRIEYFRDADLGDPPRLKKLYRVSVKVEVEPIVGADPSIRPTADEAGAATHCATVGGARAHWYVPPGSQLTRKRHTNLLPAKAQVHYATAHLHNHGIYVLLRDVATGEVLWRAEPVYEKDRAQIERIPVYSSARGFSMDPSREYEIEALYDNTSDRPVDAMAQVDLYYRPEGN